VQKSEEKSLKTKDFQAALQSLKIKHTYCNFTPNKGLVEGRGSVEISSSVSYLLGPDPKSMPLGKNHTSTCSLSF